MKNFSSLVLFFFKKNNSSKKQKNERSETKYDLEEWKDPYKKLRSKWFTIPAGNEMSRKDVHELLRLSDDEVTSIWKEARDADVEGCRGWFHDQYREFMKDKKVLDVGCGFGISSISFAEMGANVTFVDIVEKNVKLVEKVCRGLGLTNQTNFLFMENIKSLKELPIDFDVVTALGSLHNAPFDIMKPEVAEIVKHLKIGGRWLQLAYPKTRWIQEGSVPFSQWGGMTDGKDTPWCEWYDEEKLISLLSPAKFELLSYKEWYNNDFNWFDLKLLSSS